MRSTDSLEKTLMLGKTEGRMRRRWPRMRWLDSITNSMDMILSKLREMLMDRKPGMLQSRRRKESDMTEWLNSHFTNCTNLNFFQVRIPSMLPDQTLPQRSAEDRPAIKVSALSLLHRFLKFKARNQDILRVFLQGPSPFIKFTRIKNGF